MAKSGAARRNVRRTRKRILDAAVEILRRKGYAHFRTADVAKAAGVSRGAQLHHFATKEKLVYATMEHVFNNVKRPAGTGEASRRRRSAGKAIADARGFSSTSFFISLDIATSINSGRFRHKLMGMVREARLRPSRRGSRRWWRLVCRNRSPTTCYG